MSEYATKRKFIKALEATLLLDERSGVKALDYEKRGSREVITVTYKSGAQAYIDVSINSNGANITEVVREVYGAGARGRITFKDDVWPE